jgi:hypothetical protein
MRFALAILVTSLTIRTRHKLMKGRVSEFLAAWIRRRTQFRLSRSSNSRRRRLRDPQKSPPCIFTNRRHKDGAPVIFQHVVPLLWGRTTRSSRCGAKVEISRNDFQGADLPRRLLHGSPANGTKIATLRMGTTS